MIRRLFQYKDLFYVFIYRDLTVRYRQTILGVLWAVLQPISMMLLFTFVFEYLLKSQHINNYPKVIFFFSGLLPWTFFSSSMNNSIGSLQASYNLITQIYFPREIIPISGIVSAFVDFLIACVIFIILLFIYDIPLTLNAFWFIPLLALLIIFTVSISLVLASANVYYRDVQLASRFLMQMWFFGTPILYSIDKVSMKLKIFLFLNPLTFIVENMRRCTIEGRGVVVWQFVLVTVLTLIFYYLSTKFFAKTERDFADVI